jgi:hypothetical protein
MIALDRWNESGLAPLAKDYTATLRHRGKGIYSIANDGALVEQVERMSKRHALASALLLPSWLDVRTGGPRL